MENTGGIKGLGSDHSYIPDIITQLVINCVVGNILARKDQRFNAKSGKILGELHGTK